MMQATQRFPYVTYVQMDAADRFLNQGLLNNLAQSLATNGQITGEFSQLA
jgi:hypothetical protein